MHGWFDQVKNQHTDPSKGLPAEENKGCYRLLQADTGKVWGYAASRVAESPERQGHRSEVRGLIVLWGEYKIQRALQLVGILNPFFWTFIFGWIYHTMFWRCNTNSCFRRTTLQALSLLGQEVPWVPHFSVTSNPADFAQKQQEWLEELGRMNRTLQRKFSERIRRHLPEILQDCSKSFSLNPTVVPSVESSCDLSTPLKSDEGINECNCCLWFHNR